MSWRKSKNQTEMRLYLHCPYCGQDDCVSYSPRNVWLYRYCGREVYKSYDQLLKQYKDYIMRITTIPQIKEAPYRIQGMRSHHYGNDFETNKAYETFEDAQEAASSQANNKTNVGKGNRFIIYQAIAVVGPAPIIEPPCETLMLDEL